jgi:uncharacterized membrane protein YdjX (TVP38/TMEM64 family)
VLALLVGGLFALATCLLPHSPEQLRLALAGTGALAQLIFVGLWTVLTPAMVSGTVLAGAAGLVFGVGAGTPIALAGTVLGGLGSFGLARRFGAGPAGEIAGARVRRITERVEHRAFRAVMLLRLAPGMPATALNYAAGLTRMRAATFALATLAGATPRTFIYTALGGSIEHGGTMRLVALCLFAAMTAAGLAYGLRARLVRSARVAAST